MRRMHDMPFGAQVLDRGVRFRLWAPSAGEVALALDGEERPMPEVREGWRELVVPEARAGQRYAYRIDGGLLVPDPASRFQPEDAHKPSLIVDPGSYGWEDGAWRGRPWEETVVYELHVGTATPEGTYAGLMARLEDLAELGVTAVELMPLADFPGRRNWGYDGVLPYAPDSAYGTPDDLKRLIDRAHALGLMVFIDVVYNHFGPSGNYLHAYAESFFTERHHTPWGAGLNFDGTHGRPVRDFFIHNALYWLEEFHVDGLRFDAVHAILDDSEPHVLTELAERVRREVTDREVHLVLENDANQARYLERDAAGRPRLYTAQWSDDVHHCWHTLLTGETDNYYADYAEDTVRLLGRSLAEGFAYQGEPSAHRQGEARGEPSAHLPPLAFVAFLQNHDQIGNRAFGERLTELAPADRLALARAALLLSPQPPLLFMGEEWASSAPFLFFCQFDEQELSNAVREGRRREFAGFRAFSDPEVVERIPDPTDRASFVRSRIDWAETAGGAHAATLAETRRLLRLRRAEVVPLIGTPFLGARYARPGPDALEVAWSFAGGALHLLANFGPEPVALQAPEGGRVLWSSPGVHVEGGLARLGPWTGAVLGSPRP